jgi:hypothetical protein
MELSPGETGEELQFIATSIQGHRNHPSQSSTQTGITAFDPISLPHFMSSNKDEIVASGPLTPDRSENYGGRNTPTRYNSNNEPTATETLGRTSTVLQKKFKQHVTSLAIAILAVFLLGFSILFIHTEFISQKPVPKHLQLSTAHTINAVNILSHLNMFLTARLLESAYEALRWSLASRRRGVSIPTFLALSRATGFMGIADLLRVHGWHQFLCFQRLVTHPNTSHSSFTSY